MKALFKAAVLLSTLVACLFGESEARKFTEETRNKAIKNTRRVQQSFGSPRQIYWNFEKNFWRLDMRPPALEIGWEFEQSQPSLYYYVSSSAATQMQSFRLRAKLRAKAAVNINSKFNIDRLFYNEITYELDEFLAFLFGDIILIYKDLSVANPTNPFDSYKNFGICFAAGYNYQDISMQVETILKFPQCYKMLVQSLCDWSQWTTVITKFGKNQYLYGLLDQCTMSVDSP